MTVASPLDSLTDNERILAANLTKLFYGRLKIHVMRNGITFYEDLRDRHRWIREFLRTHESTVMEEIPVESVVPEMQRIMCESGLDHHGQCRLIHNLFGGKIRWESLCQSG